MKWLKVEREGYFPAFQCSNCGAIICVQDECFELPRYCEQCEGKKEYIERNVLLKIAEREVGEVFGSSLILRAIREAPAVDVAEVMIVAEKEKVNHKKRGVKHYETSL